MNQPLFNSLHHKADEGGCGHYRMNFPYWMCHTMRRDIKVIDSVKLIDKEEFYRDIRLVRVQRQITEMQMRYMLGFLHPLSQKIGFWLAYEIDDVVGMHDIPKYNTGWQAYQDTKLMDNLKHILNVVDLVTVTNNRLADYYIKNFGLNKEKIYVVPNYLPRWWIGNGYDIEKIEKRYDSLSNRKPRIGCVCSVTHFDAQNKNNGIDDFTPYIDWFKSNTDKYQFVFVGGHPQQLKQEIIDGKIEFYNGFDILNYPRMIASLGIDVALAPLQDNTFNRCKSNIKVLEMGAMGIPVACQDMVTYRGYSDMLFKDANELQNRIDETLSSKERYMNVVKKYRDIIDNGDKYSPNGYWLENNMNKWFDLYTIPQKTLRFDLTRLQQTQSLVQQKEPMIEEVTFEV